MTVGFPRLLGRTQFMGWFRRGWEKHDLGLTFRNEGMGVMVEGPSAVCPAAVSMDQCWAVPAELQNRHWSVSAAASWLVEEES